MLKQHTGISHTTTDTSNQTDEPEIQEWYFQPVHNHPPIQELIQGIEQDNAICVTDGSFKDKMGTAGMTLSPSMNHRSRHRGVNQTPGHPNDISAYRAELGGMLGIVLYLKKLCQDHQIDRGKITLACDCDSALRTCFYDEYDDAKQSNHDMIHAIRSNIASLPTQVIPEQVKGHKDDVISKDQLTQTEQLNVEMDFLAKAHWETLASRNAEPHVLPTSTSWSVWVGQHRLTSWNTDLLLEHIYKARAEGHWHKKLRSEPMSAQIDWQAHKKAMKQCPTFRRLWQPKWATGFVPTGKNLKRWKIQNTPTCPRCGEDELTTNHVLRCRENSAQAKWRRLLSDLDSWLAKNMTHPDLRTGIIQLITSWCNYENTPLIESNYTGIAETFRNQQTLGPDAFMRGFLCSDWAAVQNEHYKWINRRNTGLRWVAGLIKKLWEIAWDMWLHRKKASESPDSLTILAENYLLDEAILLEYQQFQVVSRNPTRHLSRWFARPLEAVQAEDTDFKRQWLDAVSVAKR